MNQHTWFKILIIIHKTKSVLYISMYFPQCHSNLLYFFVKQHTIEELTLLVLNVVVVLKWLHFPYFSNEVNCYNMESGVNWSDIEKSIFHHFNAISSWGFFFCYCCLVIIFLPELISFKLHAIRINDVHCLEQCLVHSRCSKCVTWINGRAPFI